MSRMVPWICPVAHPPPPNPYLILLPINTGESLPMPMKGVPLCCIKSKCLNPVGNFPVYDVCLLLHEQYYYALTSLSAWFGRSYYCMECERSYNDNRKTCKSDYTCIMCKDKLAFTSQPTQDYVRNVLEYFTTVPISTITNKTRYAHIRVRSVVTGLSDRSPITSVNHYIVLTVTRR